GQFSKSDGLASGRISSRSPSRERALSVRIHFTKAVLIAGFFTVGDLPLHSFAHIRSADAQQPRARVPFRVPSEAELTDSSYRASALRGRALLTATRDSLPRNVGNGLRCASCHLDAGLRRDAMPW